MEVPEEYQLKCPGCGKILDKRDLSILGHGWHEGGKIVCYDGLDIHYSSSKKIGESTEWTKDKKPIDLN